MRATREVRAAAGVIASATILLSGSVEAAAATKVSFVHAVPGAPAATLTVSGGSGAEAALRGVSFGEASASADGPSGRVTITLIVNGDRAARSTETLADGSGYTIVAEPGQGNAVELMAHRAGTATAGRARLRAAHGAGEVGRADFKVGDVSLGTLSRGEAGDYATVEPGTYTVMATPPGTNDAAIEDPSVNLAAGTASTAYAIGSGGERTRFVIVQDAVAAPAGGPATGLGGISGGGDSPWITALLAALAAGALGGLAYMRAARRGRGAA